MERNAKGQYESDDSITREVIAKQNALILDLIDVVQEANQWSAPIVDRLNRIRWATTDLETEIAKIDRQRGRAEDH